MKWISTGGLSAEITTEAKMERQAWGSWPAPHAAKHVLHCHVMAQEEWLGLLACALGSKWERVPRLRLA